MPLSPGQRHRTLLDIASDRRRPVIVAAVGTLAARRVAVETRRLDQSAGAAGPVVIFVTRIAALPAKAATSEIPILFEGRSGEDIAPADQGIE